MCEIPPNGPNNLPNLGHNPRIVLSDNPTDKVDRAIKSTGCSDLNNLVNECHFEHKDWRKCTFEMKMFKECMDKHKLQQNRRRSQNMLSKHYGKPDDFEKMDR